MDNFEPTPTENNKDFPFVPASGNFEARPMRPIREKPDPDYMVWGSEFGETYEVSKGQFNQKNVNDITLQIDHFGRRELEKHGWRYGQALHGQKDKTNEGLVNPIHIKGFSTKQWMNTVPGSTYEDMIGGWKEDDEHYPSKKGLVKRPGLASNPEDYYDERLQFDITTRSDQSRRHQPEPGKIIMKDGSSYYPEELKNLECLNKPSCKSRRNHSLQSRQKDLCDVCLRKQRYCQSGSARQRRTERRREARQQEHSTSAQLPVARSSQDFAQANYNLTVGRIIKATKRSSWRRPCLESAKGALLGDSQVYCTYIAFNIK